MSEEKKDKKKKKAAIIGGIIGSVALIGGVAGGIIATTETESETEENKKKKKRNAPNPSGVTPRNAPNPSGVTPRNAPSGQSLPQKKNLSNKVKTLWPNVLFDANKTNKELDSIILSDIHLTIWLQPNLVNPTIKYFSDPQAQTEVTNKAQKAGYLYVIITANDNDPNYQGSTNPIKIPLKQYKLSDITKLTNLDLTANPNKNFKNLSSKIREVTEFKTCSLMPLYSGIHFFEFESDNWPNIIDKQNQKKGNFWIVIEATFSEPNWYGKTPKIKINLK